MPEYLVIAGPNGAGKSSYSKKLSGAAALIFDPDKEKQKIERQFPDISDDAVQDELTRVYRNFEIRAIAGSLDLTVESNLRNEFVAERAKFLKDNGYQTSLIFMALPNLKASMDRVIMRVARKGHFVDAESIRYNYTASLENLLKVAPVFDQFMLVNSGHTSVQIQIPSVLVKYKQGIVVQQSADPPDWSLQLITDIQNTCKPDDPGHQFKHGLKR